MDQMEPMLLHQQQEELEVEELLVLVEEAELVEQCLSEEIL